MPDLVPHVLPAGTLSRRPQPVLTADDLVLRPWEEGDAPALMAAYADPGIRYWNGAGLDEVEARTYAQRWADHWRDERRAGWAVVRNAELAGRITLRGIDHEQGSAEITYWVVPAARGTGVASGAVAALVGWAFDDAGFHRLELQHSTRNPASCRVAEKCGFALEGTRVRSSLHDDGWHDMHLHARVAQD